MSKIRRINIIEQFKKLVLDNPDYTVAQLISTITRSKNFPDKDFYDVHDIELSACIENTIYELKKEEDE